MTLNTGQRMTVTFEMKTFGNVADERTAVSWLYFKLIFEREGSGELIGVKYSPESPRNELIQIIRMDSPLI